MPVFVGALIILQIISTFIFTPPIMAIIGCITILVSSIYWEFKGGVIAATICSLLVLIGYFTVEHFTSTLTIIVVTILLYYLMGVGTGSVVGTIRRQRKNLIISEERYKSADFEQ